MAKKPSRTTLRNKCDRMWSLAIRQKAKHGTCARCGMVKPLQAAHIIPRRHYATRWDLRNGIPLCGECHAMFDGYKIDREKFIERYIGAETYSALKESAMKPWDRDYEGVLQRLGSTGAVSSSGA